MCSSDLEFSVRASLGASRWRLVRQQLIESALLASAGGAGGILLASWGSRVLVRQLSTDSSPLFLDLSLDWHILMFTMGMALTTVLVFGVAPALQGSGGALMNALNRRGATAGIDAGRRGGFSGAFVVGQVALSVILLVAAGLFVRTFVSLTTRPLGFDRERLLVVSVNTHSASMEASQRVPFYERARDSVRALPGVADAAVSMLTPPVTGPMPVLPMAEVAGVRLGEGPDARASAVNVVTPGWFSTFGTPIIAGRDFSDRDRAGAPRVAVVNRAFVRKFLGGASPVGRFITPSVPPPAPSSPVEIVGVAADAVYGSLRDRKSTRLNSSHIQKSRMPSSA